MAADNPVFIVPWFFVAVAIGTVVLSGAIVAIVALLWPRGKRREDEFEDRSIDVTTLPVEPLPAEGPRLEYYGTPVRLAVLVLAPAGRGVVLPSKDELRDLVENLIPGMARIVDLHRPVFRRWPQQLSSQGFTQSFLLNIPLPGDRGKGTPWCAAAGKFESTGGQFLAGIVCRAEAANSLSHAIVQHHGQWHDVLRVKN